MRLDQHVEVLKQLGEAIRVMVKKSDDYLISAGLKLLEARKIIKSGGVDLTWRRFLAHHCGGLSKSRANELIQIAEGKKTVEETRERARQGMAATRSRRRAADVRVRNVTDVEPEPVDPHRVDATKGSERERVVSSRLAAALDAYDALNANERIKFLEARGLREVCAEEEKESAEAA